jgi:hypothetical protein
MPMIKIAAMVLALLTCSLAEVDKIGSMRNANMIDDGAENASL